MMPETIEHAPAKVNLSLHVTGRRQDGYHLLDSLVVFTEAGDYVRVRSSEKDEFFITGPFAGSLRNSNDNLVTRARDLLRDLTGIRSPVEITLEKNLPIASGIGGGSSDAAATLRALVRLWKLTIGTNELARLALNLGADLPMCLSACALVARGIGEDVEIVRGVPALALVLVNPGQAVETPAVFRALASRDNTALPSLPARLDLKALINWLSGTRNDLQQPALKVAPVIADVLQSLENNESVLTRMSGSGATCFGLFASLEAADHAATSIAAAHPSWYVKATRTVEKVDAHVPSR